MDIKNLLIDEIKKIQSWETERKFKTDEANEYRAEVLGWLERFLTCIESSELENDDYRELAKLFKDDVSGRIEQMQENMTYEKYLADIEELGEKEDSLLVSTSFYSLDTGELNPKTHRSLQMQVVPDHHHS